MAYKTIIGTMKTAGTLDISAGDIDLAAGSVDNADLAGSIANSKLANSAVTVTAGDGLSGGGSVALGASVSVAVDLNELTAAAVDVANDSLALIDATDNGSKKESIADLMTAVAGDGLKASSGVLAMDLNELSAAAVAVSADSIAIIDATDNSSKKESIADLVTAMAGDGLAASSGVLAVGVDDSTVELNSDALRVKAAGIGVSHLATAVAGDGLAGGGGSALSVQVSGAVRIKSDKVAISGSVAGAGLKYLGGVDSISGLELDLSEYSRVDVAAGDHFLVLDADGSTVQLERFDKLANAMAGDGLEDSSGVLAVKVDDSSIEINSDTVRIKDNGVSLAKMAGLARGKFIYGDASGDPAALAVGSAHQFLQADGTDLAWVSMSGDVTLAAGVASIGATKVTDAMMNDDVATGLAGNGLSAASGVLALDLNELSAAAVDRANDSIVIIDATDNSSKKESIADLASAFADGDGIEAADGKLSVKVDDSSVEINSDALRVKASGITNAMLAGSIANAKLSNSAVTVGSTSLSLGGSATAFSGLTGLDFTAANASIGASIGANTLTLGGNDSHVRIAGNLEVVGSLDAVSATELRVEDLTIQCASGSANSSASDGAGLKIDGADASFLWNHAGQHMVVNEDTKLNGMTAALASISTDTTLNQKHFLVKVDTSGGAVTVTLPSSMPTGKVFVVKQGGHASNAVTIDTAGSETIDGAASISLGSAYGAANLMFDGSNYLIW
jgi:hypothetical protein